MLATTFHNALAINIFLAIITHVWYRNNEPKSLVLPVASIIILSIPSTALLIPHLESISYAFALAFVTFLTALLGSISLYRLSPLHPLAKYPGPTLCKLTKLWTAWVSFEGRVHIYYKTLHDKYGPIVRIGPNELSIVNVELIPYIIGPQGLPKGPLWDGRIHLIGGREASNYSLIGVRDLRRHAQLRKPWNNAFQSAALIDYEEMLRDRAAQFMTHLQKLCEDEVCFDLANLIDLFSFDFMGDFVFGGIYSFMRDGDVDGILPNLKRGYPVPGAIQHVPWLTSLLRGVPFIVNDAKSLRSFAIKQSQKRAAQLVVNRKDLFFYLLEATKPDDAASLQRVLASNSLLALVAGSDTSATALSHIIYYLICNPEYQQRLRDELDESLEALAGEPIKSNLLATLPFLNAVINEAFRLQPPVPSSLQRAPAIGSGGRALGPNMIITEGTAIQVPPYVIHRDPRYFFPNPDKFWPDRWIKEDPSIILERNAFIPFSTGPASCPGKPLAMIELRLMTCLIVRAFELSFEDGYDSSRWEEGLLDRFVMDKGSLPVKLKARH